MARQRLPRHERRQIIIDGAISAHKAIGPNYTRKDAAAACSVKTSHETVKQYFATMPLLRETALAEMNGK